jgi:hypothetical protein
MEHFLSFLVWIWRTLRLAVIIGVDHRHVAFTETRGFDSERRSCR